MGSFESKFSTRCKKLKTIKCKEESFKTYGKSRKGIKSRATCFPYFFPELHQACTSKGHSLSRPPGVPQRPYISLPLADPYSPFTSTQIPCATVGQASAECFVTLRGKAQQKLSPSSMAREQGVSDGRRTQHWMMVQLWYQHSHLLSLHSCAALGRESAAAGARPAGPSRQEKKMLWKQWMCGAGQVKYMRRGRRGQP